MIIAKGFFKSPLGVFEIKVTHRGLAGLRVQQNFFSQITAIEIDNYCYDTCEKGGSNGRISTEILPYLHALQGYFSGQSLPELALDLQGTAFQIAVWKCLQQIPRGETRTYGQIAQQLGNFALAQAVGRACAANPLWLWIPCHRVVAAGGMGGFAGGLSMKKWLLDHEKTEYS